jgi:hypothetical protein
MYNTVYHHYDDIYIECLYISSFLEQKALLTVIIIELNNELIFETENIGDLRKNSDALSKN